MTALNIIRQEDAIHIVTDGAMSDGQGRVLYFGGKVIAMPGLSAAIAMLGTINTLSAAGTAFEQGYRSFDDMVQDAPRQMKELNELFISQHGDAYNPQLELHVVGWSEARQKMDAYFVAGHDMHSKIPGYEHVRPWTLQETPAATFNPPPCPKLLAANGVQLDRFDLDLDSAALVDAQRRNPALPARACIGGFVQITTVTRDSILQRVVHRWPEDRVGQPIERRAA